MWETFISWYINNYLGKYVENLNSQQLSVALGRGELELENVPLKRNIFRSWGLPIHVKSSVVGRIRIEFNILKYFRNEPVLITIEDVFLVAGPIELSELDPLEEEALAQESKMSALDAHEGRWKAQFDLQNHSSSYYSSFYASSVRIGASIVTKVVENLQLNVKNVHVRFEYESAGRVVAFGVTLAGLSVQSCDGKWVPLSSGGVAALGDLSFKTLKMSKLGVYCDTRAEKMSELGVEELRAAMTKPLPFSVYILSPVSPEAKVTKNNSTAPLSSSSKPRFDVHLTLDKVPLQLSESQYKYSFRLYKSLRKLNRNVRLRHYRPFGAVSKENVKEWWRHATQAVLTLRGFKRRNKLTSWDAVLARAKLNCLYVHAYQQHLTDEVLSGEARKLKDNVEFELHFDDIVELRKIAMRKVEALYSDAFLGPSATPQPQPTSSPVREGEPIPRQSSSGVISWFFPSWYSQVPATEQQHEPSLQDANTSISARDSSVSVGERTISETEFEEEILGEMRAFGRDVLLARFSFTLNQGAVLLNKKNTSFLDLSFDGVSVELSLRPRFGSHKFQMRLSSLLLKDSVTKSAILCPHASSISSLFITKTTPASVENGPLFNLVYEMNPNKKAGHRISVATRPMDLIIYPTTWDQVGDFFSVKVEEDYLEIPYNGYEAMKQKTKEELQVYWERLIHSKSSTDNGNGESWDIYMDIFAPQITIYGYQTERVITKPQPKRLLSNQLEEAKRKKTLPVENPPPPSAVIIDLGRFKFSNLEETVQSPTGLLNEDVKDGGKEEEEEEEEEFLTPCSSPVPEKSESTVSSPRHSVPDVSEGRATMSHKETLETFGDSLDEIQSKFYKKYSLEITDVQVLVLDRKYGNVREASFKALRGTSMMHFVDKFSINLQLERRLVYSEDPLWPALTLVGTLPNLTFHLNESKILTLRSVFNAFTSPAVKNPLEPFDLSFQSGSQFNIPDADKSEIRLSDTLPASTVPPKPSGKLFVAEFTIHNVSVDLQARDRNIAELQIVGTKTVLTHRECDTEFSFVIQSLLLADAVQTFGPDYQLLLASHKHVCMDSVSGSLLDSEPTSPTSPVSPPSPMPPLGMGHSLRPCPGNLEIPTHTQLHHALMNSLQLKKRKLLSSVGCQTPVPGSDALIIIDVTLTKREEDMAIVTVQFNNLDVIANQETVVEIMQFFNAVLPRSKPEVDAKSKLLSETSIIPHDSGGKKVQANFEFHRLNVLLLRGVVGKDGCQVARKIATVTASNARVNCSLQNSKLNVDGSLGGLQVLNLTPEGQRHQRVLSVGQDPLVDASYNPFNTEANFNIPLHVNLQESAFSFRYEKSELDTGAKLSIRMASVIYSHCSLFLMDLKKCINQFQAPLTTTLKSAATQIALGLVGHDAGSGSNRSPYGSLGSLEHIDVEEGLSGSFSREVTPKYAGTGRSCIKLEVILDSPIIVLPRSNSSPEVLVAHLGQISISGCDNATLEEEGECTFSPEALNEVGSVRYNVFIRDASLYSLDLRKRWAMMENFKMTHPNSNLATLMRAQDLYRCDSTSAIPILHNTVIQFYVSYNGDVCPEDFMHEEDAEGEEAGYNAVGSRVEIHGRVVSSLKVSLNPQQYSQLLDSVSNVASAGGNEPEFVTLDERRMNWEKEKLLFGRAKGAVSTAPPLPSPSRSSDNPLTILSCFEVPDLIVELVLPDDNKAKSEYIPSLNLSCSDLLFKCDKKWYGTDMSISLKALKLEDLNVPPSSWKRVLALSKTEESKRKTGDSTLTRSSQHVSFSTSCPDFRKSSPLPIAPGSSSFERSTAEMIASSSLPEELDPKDFFLGRCFASKPHSKGRRRSSLYPGLLATRPKCPVTPPPSPRPGEKSSDNLVQILVTFPDPKCPKFLSEYAGNHKIVNVDFNSLDVLLTPDTFCCLRRFFVDASEAKEQQSGSQQHHNEHFSRTQTASSNAVADQDRNTETVIKVKSLNLKLAKSTDHLAEAVVSEVSCDLQSRGQNNFGVVGRLGSLEVRDISPHCGIYPVKFTFQGDQALDFDYSRNGTDGKFRLAMSSIVVVHTHRFYTEFMNLWSSLFGETAVESQNQQDGALTEVTEPEDKTRILLDIQAGAPVIILPCSSTSDKALVGDLGHLSVKNKFIDDLGGLVINYITVDLMEMDIYSGELVQTLPIVSQKKKQWNLQKGWSVVKTENSLSFLQKQCQLNLKVKRIFAGSLGDSVAATRVQGGLSTVHCTIDSEKYKLIRGLLSHNIGENIGPIHSTPHNFQRKLQAGKSSSTQAKVELNVQLDLVNVRLEVLKGVTSERLGRVDFIKSKFTFQTNSDGSKDVDLASQEIIVYDSRFEDKKQEQGEAEETGNIFTNILQPSIQQQRQRPVASTSSAPARPIQQIPLQAEIHYRTTQRGSNVTIVLNNMRLMLILDWWMEVREFLTQEIPHPPTHLTIEFENSSGQERGKNASPLLERSRGLSSPVTVSTGIVTKRAPVLDVPDSVFELKVNISNCELVAVEKASVWDTNALILKASAAFGYRPHLERPITCNILQCELFSCTLGLESETALSILDPTTIQFDVVRHTEQESQGILDATLSLASCGKILKIQSPSLNLRLSYYDMRMFLRFMEKFSKDAQSHFTKKDLSADIIAEIEMGVEALENLPHSLDIDRLVVMGFSHEDAVHALEETQGSFEDAVYLLTNASGIVSPSEQNRDSYKSRSKAGSLKSLSIDDQGSSYSTASSSIQGIEVKCNCLSLCVIDDCKDSDVPVVEMSVQQLDLFQNCVENVTCADCVLTGDYYNRTLSGWEPFLEPWKCSVKWKKNLLGQLDDYSPSNEFPSRAPEFEVYVSSKSLLDLNITSTLLQLYKTVSDNWTEDYQEPAHKGEKRRAPFVPFALKNETGSRLWFCTIISNSEEVFRQQQKGNAAAGQSSSDTTGWIEVKHGATQSFSFEGRGKLRHRNTHQLKTHQLAVRVDGWNEVTPVSVDRVGTYFRVARPEERRAGGHERRYGSYMELPPTRLVLEVSLQGSAQKIVTVRSALMIKNALPEPVELKLENTIVYPSFERAQTGGSLIVQIQPDSTYPVPLHSVWAHMWVRPVIPEEYPLLYLYCSKALLIGSSQDQEGLRECVARSPELAVPYRFCVAVKRNEFPADSDEIIPRNSLPNIIQLMSMSNRANLITLLSPFKLVNLLPHEISFEILGKNCSGRIGPGKTQCMSGIDTNEPLDLHYQVDNFPEGVTVSVNSKSNSSFQRIKLQDTMKRTLVLTVKVLKEEGGVLSIHLCCPCWIVNKSGLPLLCKQEGTSGEAAGQFQEHEVGRMVTPLMMSFADAEGTEALTLRVGTGLHKDSKPFWCRSFLCQNGLRVRKLTVSHCNNSPESVYMVGVEIKNGTGRYRDTKLVVVSPRFVVDNRSQYKIQISQWAYANSFFDAKAEKTHLTLPSGCNLPFHWPRLDREQLLCVRLKDAEGNRGAGSSGGHWSGGFPVDNVDSFFINIRDPNGACLFLRVEIVLQGPSYFVIFTDTTQLPPPFRIDNFTLVSLLFHQACLTEERLKLTARAECSIPYALDEPTKAPHLTVTAPGGSSLIVNMDDLRYVSQLTYENFFYIACTATFPGGSGDSLTVTKSSGMESLELVLDVEGTRVFLGKKEQGKRSQLWRVNADGLIEHEGSSPPRDLSKRQEIQSSSSSSTMLVLDIAGPAPVPSQCVPLMLRKPDRRRISTQHWEFTNDGRMKCRMYDGLYVQAKDGFGTFGSDQQQQQGSGQGQGGSSGSWQQWSDVVLGPSQPVCYIRTDSGIPAEQAVARQKLRPGSGILNLNVETDGPTRVLRIVDVEHPPRHHLLRHTFEENDVNTTPKYRVKVDLPVGVGISIVSCTPTREELMYGRLFGLSLGITDTPNSQVLEALVMNLQLDNQLFESEKTAVIYIPSSSRSPDSFLSEEDEVEKHPPALHFYSESLKSNLNARVYKIWELVVKPISLIVEERLLLKLCRWLGKGQQVQSLDMLQQSDFEVQKALTSTANYDTRRYYFGCLKVVLDQVKLSVLTASSKLPPDLLSLKRRLGLTLIRFEDANVDLDPFEKHHPFETFEFLWALVVKHYRDELVSQAAVILGSTDFLGNPLGFVNDVSEGVSLMIYEGSVGALVKNVAHGLSNSAAKVTGTLGEGLGKTILDDRHEEERRRIKEDHAGSSGEHLYAGLKGFGHGLIGGVTSVVSQSYEGVSNEGFTGLFTGFTKGVVGTFTKPAVGLLDFATGAASAIRDSSKTSSRMIPQRMRPTRVVVGNGGLLPIYSEPSALGQELLFELNDRNYRELFIACETLKSNTGQQQELRIMISSSAVTVFRSGKGNPVILRIPMGELLDTQLAPTVEDRDRTPYIEFVRQLPDLMAPCRPQVICEQEVVAKRVVKQVNYAKVLFKEMRHSQIGTGLRGTGEEVEEE